MMTVDEALRFAHASAHGVDGGMGELLAAALEACGVLAGEVERMNAEHEYLFSCGLEWKCRAEAAENMLEVWKPRAQRAEQELARLVAEAAKEKA